jgi:hypothetical protein
MGDLCYLCSNSIEKKELSSDHVPPKSFFPHSFRNKFNLSRLITLPTHKGCNIKYKDDEEYFVNSIGPSVMESSHSGRALWQDIKRGFRYPEGLILARKISKEFSDRTESGIILPNDKMIKKFDGERIWGVVWKIVRGLFYKEYDRFLPENTPRLHELFQPGTVPPEHFQHLNNTPSHGAYAAVFAYKYLYVKELNNFHYWGFLLWDNIIMTTRFSRSPMSM